MYRHSLPVPNISSYTVLNIWTPRLSNFVLCSIIGAGQFQSKHSPAFLRQKILLLQPILAVVGDTVNPKDPDTWRIIPFSKGLLTTYKVGWSSKYVLRILDFPYIPMTWGWDVSTINPTIFRQEVMGVLGVTKNHPSSLVALDVPLEVRING